MFDLLLFLCYIASGFGIGIGCYHCFKVYHKYSSYKISKYLERLAKILIGCAITVLSSIFYVCLTHGEDVGMFSLFYGITLPTSSLPIAYAMGYIIGSVFSLTVSVFMVLVNFIGRMFTR